MVPEPPEPIDGMAGFEQDLHQALLRRPAPPALKARILAARSRRRTLRIHRRVVLWQRLAASLVLAAVLGGGFTWRHVQQQQRQGEEARRQVLTALRITNRALNEVNARLAARDRASETE
ncbi:MAG: hypothetical protein P4L40_22955 [Terracidiphilus sp.]|nr:hypothetical protein [Terracidiphilus sp.]